MDPRVLCRIRLLGPLRVAADGHGLVRFPTRKVEALFGMIALAGDKGLDRDMAAALLWSRSPEGQARANLRQALAGLRRAVKRTYSGVELQSLHTVKADIPVAAILAFFLLVAAGKDRAPSPRSIGLPGGGSEGAPIAGQCISSYYGILC